MSGIKVRPGVSDPNDNLRTLCKFAVAGVADPGFQLDDIFSSAESILHHLLSGIKPDPPSKPHLNVGRDLCPT